jgi:hypothetical protein
MSAKEESGSGKKEEEKGESRWKSIHAIDKRSFVYKLSTKRQKKKGEIRAPRQ